MSFIIKLIKLPRNGTIKLHRISTMFQQFKYSIKLNIHNKKKKNISQATSIKINFKYNKPYSI